MFLLSSLEEAENERMHLMTALEMKQPGIIFRGTILFAQGTIHSLRMLSLLYPFVNLFLLFHLERSVRKPVFPGLPGQSQVLP